MMISFCKKSIEFTVNYIGKYTYFIFLCLLVHILTENALNSPRIRNVIEIRNETK